MAANRIPFLLLFVLHFCFHEDTSAQPKIPLLERRVNIHCTDQPPEEVLQIISQQGKFTFPYDPQVIKGFRPVTMNVQSKSVREALDKIFEMQLTYKEKGSHIILTR